MTYKDHGYYGYAYIGARLAKVVTLVPIIGLVGNFLSLIAKSKHSPPSELVATIAVVSSHLPTPCLRLPFSLFPHTYTDKPPPDLRRPSLDDRLHDRLR